MSHLVPIQGQFYDVLSDYGVQVAFAVLADLLLLAMTGIKTLDIRLYLKHLGVKRSYTTLLLRDGESCSAIKRRINY